jgi:hypothetical protein
MSDILIRTGFAVQESSAPTELPNFLVSYNFYQNTSQACIIDITPPTFAGINTLVLGSRGQIRATWLAASDPTLPVRYEIYIKEDTSSGLFNSLNLIAITDKLEYSTFTMPDGSYLVNGSTYFVGVKAIDGVNNRDGNTVSLSVISTGVWVSSEAYEVSGAFTVNPENKLQGTIWGLKNTVLATSGNATLGYASYQVYDKTGAAVVGMSGTLITSDVNGQFKITPVNSILSDYLDHYLVKITITIDGADRIGYTPIVKPEPVYKVNGNFFVNTDDDFDGTFWAIANETVVTANIGTGSYQVYDHDASPIVGMSETGIVPDVNGIFKITHIPSLIDEITEGYFVKVNIQVHGITRTNIIPLGKQIPSYKSKSGLSINALNQLQGTLWAEVNGVARTFNLGAANYTVYDSAGVAVAGLTQSGITPDVNGRYFITPVSAILLTDLTHYSVKVGIIVDSVERIRYKTFTLLGN